MRTAFDLLDTDRDGMVTPTELQFMLRNLGIEMSDELIDGLMKEASKTGENLLNAFGSGCGETLNYRRMTLTDRKLITFKCIQEIHFIIKRVYRA